MRIRMITALAVALVLIVFVGLVGCDAQAPNAPAADQVQIDDIAVVSPSAKVLGHGHQQISPGKSCTSCHKKNGFVDMHKKPKSPDCNACHKSGYTKGF